MIARLGKSETVGEMSFLADETAHASASVIAELNTEVHAPSALPRLLAIVEFAVVTCTALKQPSIPSHLTQACAQPDARAHSHCAGGCPRLGLARAEQSLACSTRSLWSRGTRSTMPWD